MKALFVLTPMAPNFMSLAIQLKIKELIRGSADEVANITMLIKDRERPIRLVDSHHEHFSTVGSRTGISQKTIKDS